MKKILLIALMTTFSVGAYGLELKGQSLPDQVTVAGKTLLLNGVGIRHKTFFKVEIYLGALYLVKKSSDAGEILNSAEPKHVELVFVHNASADKIRGAWDEALEDNCKDGCQAFKAAIEQLKSKMADLSVGDRLAFDLFPDHLDTFVKGKSLGSIRSDGFSKVFLKTWLGEHPIEDDLKAAMLGKNNH